MYVDIRRFASVLVCCAAGPVAALAVAAAAAADPGSPVGPPAPGPAPAPAAASAPQADPADPALAASGGTPHLASPDALPPGATMDPTGQGTETPNLSYLKDLWHAVQSQEISGKEALILGIAQRGMNTPVPGQAPGPNVPISPGASGAVGGPVPPEAPVPAATPAVPGTPAVPTAPQPAVPGGPPPAPLP